MSKISKLCLDWVLSVVKNVYFWIGVVLLLLPILFDKVFNVFFNHDITLSCYILGGLILFNKFITPLEWFQTIFGDMSWRAPNWPRVFTNKSERKMALEFLIKHRIKIGIWSSALIVLVSGVYYWTHKPAPKVNYTVANVLTPSKTRYYKDNTGVIKSNVSNLMIRFDEGVAPLKDIGKEIKRYVDIRPHVDGTWKWMSESELVFTPKDAWPLGEKYKIEMEQNLIAPQFKIKNTDHQFSTESFNLSYNKGEFYENPENPAERKVIFTLNFNYPVDEKTLVGNITIKQLDYHKKNVQKEKPLKYTIVYDELRYMAYIHTENIEIPKHEGEVTLEVSPGVRAEVSTTPHDETVKGSQRIPGLFNYFHIAHADIQVVDNEKGIPEHIAIVESSTGISPNVLKDSLKFYELPKYKDDKADYPTDWTNEKHNLNLDTIKKEYTELSFSSLTTAETYPKNQSFKLSAKIGSYVAIIIPKGIVSGSGIELQESHLSVVKVKPFPKKIKIMQDGSLLQLKGEKKLSIYSMNVSKMKIRIGQVLDHQVQHIITQGNGGQKSTVLDDYNFNEKNLAHFREEIRNISKDPTSPQYEVINFAPYLNRVVKGKKTRGLFFLEIESVRGKGESYNQVKDKRLVLITDLGVIVKKDKTEQHHVFVQSLSTGSPLSGVTVQIIGQNGLPILTQATNDEGYVNFPKVNYSKLEPGQRPIGYLVKSGSDISYLKYDDYDRKLNYSRFDVGGVYENSDKNALKAYLFSDRGVYRPGENVKIGHIVKAGSWKKDLDGLPIKIKVTDARSKIIVTQKQTLTKMGLGEFTFFLSQNAPTGSYNISLYNIKEVSSKRERRTKMVTYDQFIGSTTIKVQEFTPDKLKIIASIDPKKTLGWVSPKGLKGKLNLKNLYGLAAANHNVRYQFIVSPETLRFSKYKDYSFDNPSKEVEAFDSEWSESETDANGDSSYNINLDRFAKKVFRLRLIAEGFEKESGRSVIGTDSTLVSPHEFLIGVKGEGDYNYINAKTKMGIHYISINSNLEKTNTDNVFLHLQKINYVNVLTKRYNGSYGYESVRKVETLTREKFSIEKEGTFYTLITENPGDFIVNVENAKGLKLSEFQYSVVGERNLARSLTRNAELQVKLNKTDYQNGEEIEFEIKAPYLGSGLITIERDKVYSYKWFTLSKKTSVIKVKVPNGIEGNAYLNINFMRRKNSNEIFMSPFSYGAFPFTVSRKSKTEDIKLVVPELSKPGQDFTVKYSTSHDSDIVLFAVNEGILQYAKYKNPNPLSYYLTKRSMGVRTWQILDLLLPENSIVRSSLAAGGGYGSGAKHLNPFKRRNRKPIAYWSGVLKAGVQEKEWTFKIPGHFNGQVRVIAVAVNRNRIGNAIQKGLVQADIILSTTTPTFVTPGDMFIAPLSVVNNIPGATGALPIDINMMLSKQLAAEGELKAQLQIEKGLDKSHKFQVKAKDQLGSGEIIYRAKYGEYTNEIEDTLSIRPSSNLNTDFKFGFVKDNKVELDSSRNVYSENSDRSITLAATPMSFAPLLKNLLKANPYYCTEQLVSKGFPALLTGVVDEVESQKVVNIIQSRQKGNGEIQVYPGYDTERPFISLYALHFLLEAKTKNVTVSRNVMKKIGNYVTQNFENFNTLREQSYALYLLTRMEVVTTPYLKKVENKIAELVKQYGDKKIPADGDLTLAYLAATHMLLKNEKSAYRYIEMVQMNRNDSNLLTPYYSLPQSNAQILYILAKHFPTRAKGVKGETIAKVFSTIKNLNTLNNAYLLLALDSWESLFDSKNIAADVTLEKYDGKNWNAFESKNIDGKKIIFDDTAKKIRVSNKSDWPLFYTFALSGFNKDKVKKTTEGVEIFKEIRGEDGTIVKEVKQGQKITVHLTFRTTNGVDLNDLVLVDLYPSGFEAVMDENGKAKGENYSPDYIDMREDRLLVYTKANKDVKRITYQLKATNLGSYSLPAALIEDMYELKNRATTEESSINVISSK